MAAITGSIKVNVVNSTDPSLVRVYTGDFSYDDTHLTKAGKEYMTINGGGNQTRPGLLSLNFRFLDLLDGVTPVTYTLNDVYGLPDIPVLVFENGIPTQFGFSVVKENENGVLDGTNRLMFGDPGTFLFIVGNQISGEGSVTLEINDSTSVPEDFSMM